MAGDGEVVAAQEESLLTVLLALGANLGVAILKLFAGLVSGSGALLSEAAHSFGDSMTELLLLTALRRSGRAPDRRHPFGYGKERYFWSLLAAVAIFGSGAVFSLYQGFRTIADRPHESHIWLNLAVLAGAAVLEGVSLRQGLRQATMGALRRDRSLSAHLHDPDDPTVKSVVLEDSAALIGLAVAALGVSLHAVTGSAVYDGIASLLIGLLLVWVAFELAESCKALLIGQQADLPLVKDIAAWLEEQPEVVDVVDLLTMWVGVDSILLCVRLDVEDDVTSADLERACVRMDSELRQRFPVLGEIFLEPVPRGDPEIRQRVLSRYGRVLADEPAPDEGPPEPRRRPAGDR
jgi:cation diffusion facilitator family transporter